MGKEGAAVEEHRLGHVNARGRPWRGGVEAVKAPRPGRRLWDLGGIVVGAYAAPAKRGSPPVPSRPEMSAGFREMDGGDVDGGIASRAGGATEGRSTIDGTGCDLMPPPAASRDWRSTAHSRRVGRPRASSVVLVAAGCRRVVPSGVTRAPPRSEVRCSPWDARYCMRVWGRARRRQLPNLNTTPTNITPYILSALRVIYCPGDVRTWRPRVADSRLVLTPSPAPPL